MKIRKGFVTNSSSSSFIIAIQEEFSSADELYKLVYADEPYGDKGVLEALYFEKTTLKTEDEIRDYFYNNSSYDYNSYYVNGKYTIRTNEEIRTLTDEEANKFIEKVKSEGYNYVFEVNFDDKGVMLENRLVEHPITYRSYTQEPSKDLIIYKKFSHH